MLRPTRLALPLTAALLLAAPTAAHAAKATFTGVFEAERSVEWSHPRTVSSTDCSGEKYYWARGGEEASLSSKPFTVEVEKFSVGPARFNVVTSKRLRAAGGHGFEATGPDKRWLDDRAGNTGGWCDDAGVQEPPERDCGTKLPRLMVSLYGDGGLLSWNAGVVPWMQNEKLSFYACTLLAPTGMTGGSTFPKLEGKYSERELFNRKQGRVVINASKPYGPDSAPIGNGKKRTTSGKVSWKLTLTRKR